MKKKIIFKIQEFPHLSETFIILQITTAIRLGFDVKILVKKILSFEASKQLGIIENYKLSDKIILEDYKIPKNKALRLLKFLYLLFINFNSFFKIIRFYKSQNSFSLTWLYQWHFYKKFSDVSMFHIQYGTNKYPLDLLKKADCVKGEIIVSFHGHDAVFPINGHIPNNGYYDGLFLVSKAVVANTQYLANQIENLGCSKEILKTIPIPVDTSFFYPNEEIKKNKDVLKLIMVSRLDPIKGHIYAFRAFKELIDKGYKLLLIVIGEGEERENLENYINKKQLKDIILIGAKSQHEIRELLWQSDIFLFPSITLPDGRRETQGLATLEAQACGIPVVAFNTGGIKYTIDINKTGFLCEEKNIEELSMKIQYLINNPHKRIQMGKQAVKFIANNYSLKKIEISWKKLYTA
ncbi:glycosyltransferase family 4 protein [Flavobacteriaceae bacterium MHTCC 0001]